MLHSTDGNLHALAQYQRQVDEADAHDRAVEEVCKQFPDMSVEEAEEYLYQEALSAEEDRAATLFNERAARAGEYGRCL